MKHVPIYQALNSKHKETVIVTLQELYQYPLHSPKETVWYVISTIGIIGPYFFENHHENASTVNDTCYTDLINQFLIQQLNMFPQNNSWFQQDDATSHTARALIHSSIRRLFRGRIVSKRGHTEWSPKTADLLLCDYCLYLKSKVIDKVINNNN